MPFFRNSSKARGLLAAFLLLATLALSGCALFCRIPSDPMGYGAGDRCYIEDWQFIHADKLYGRLGSIVLVDRHLCEIDQWRDCEINEAIYRLRKVHGIP